MTNDSSSINNTSFGLSLSKPVLSSVEVPFDRLGANGGSGSSKTWLARGSPHACWPCTGPPE